MLFAVARMCYNSEASGTHVYIDTSGAKATENLPANVCQCSVKFYNAKQLNINTTGPPSVCGSAIELKRSKLESLWSDKHCGSYITATSLTWQADEMVVSLHKQSKPFQSNFCVSLNLGTVITLLYLDR